MKHLSVSLFVICLVMGMFSCGKKTEKPEEKAPEDSGIVITGDSMFYGLTCDGSGDSVIIVYPMEGGDPISYNCIDAKQNGKIIGKPSVGDWIGIVLDKEDSTVASMVINLDQLKGTWTYPVMPQMKDYMHLSKRMQRRMEREALENMPDSVKELYMVPREYGFSLKRSHVAQAVGRVFSGSSLEDDSPVEYPTVKDYKHWYAWNGRLILISEEKAEDDKITNKLDTFDFVSLSDDSLVLLLNGTRRGYHRKSSVINANAAATEKARQVADKKAAELK